MDQSADTHEPWTILTFLMARYPQLRFGPTVLCQVNRSPALVAKEAAVLQLLSGGRLILGVGAGWKEDELHAYGYNFRAGEGSTRPARRNRPDHPQDVDGRLTHISREILFDRQCLLLATTRSRSRRC